MPGRTGETRSLGKWLSAPVVCRRFGRSKRRWNTRPGRRPPTAWSRRATTPDPSPGVPASPPVPKPTAQKNFTDPESRIMPSSRDTGSFVQGSNCQAVGDATAQMIVATEVTYETNDKQHAQPLLGQVLTNNTQGRTTVSLDAGSCSEANVQAFEELGTEPLLPRIGRGIGRHQTTRPGGGSPRACPWPTGCGGRCG